MSVAAHMTSPKSKGLFNQGIMESNPLALPFHSRDTAKENADAMMEYLNCPIDDVECMRTKSMDEILEAQDKAPTLNLDNLFINFLPWSPLVEDNGEIPQQPLTALQSGEIAQVPMMGGSMLDEGQLFVYELFTKPLNEKAYKGIVAGVFGAHNYPEIIHKYPFDVVENSTDGRQALNVIATDLLFYCPLRNVTRGYQKALGVKALPTYIYRFTHVISFDCWGPDYQFCVGWVCHGSELPFVFHVFDDGVSLYYEPTADELQLSEDLANYWTNFVSTGDPNRGLITPEKFPLYLGAQDTILEMNEPGTTQESHYRDSFCDMWDRMGYFY
jgi:carboxylesterase type B